MFGLFSKNKGPFTANIKPLGKSITVKSAPSENLLKVALENGINWPHNCRVGSCGTCKCKLLKGKIKELNDFSYVLTGEEMDAGYILACQTMLKSDIDAEVEIEGAANSIELPKSRQLTGKITGVSTLTHDIVDVSIELESAFDDYLPGQYADIIVPGVIDKPRSYSFSQSPLKEQPSHVSFFIRRVPDGTFTEWLHAGSAVGETVELSGPHGSFYFRDHCDGPILLVAGGSGLAPIRALLQQMIIEKGIENDITLIFGARTQRDLYCLDEINVFAEKAHGKFEFIPVLSMENGSGGWTGATGHCPDAITSEMVGPIGSQAYLCGPPPMIDAALSRLKSIGLDEKSIFFDKFLDASSMPGGRT